LAKPVKAFTLTSKLLASAYSFVKVKVSVIEHSDAAKRRNGYQAAGGRLAFCASRRPQLTFWLGLEGLTFLIWDFETSHSALSFDLYDLALHLDIQYSLREEILQVLCKHDCKQTHDVIKNMAYLDRVVTGHKLREFKQ
jgi:hypothetical protein